MRKVYLVGAGPGDAGLLTVRALELIGRADVIIYDRLADESILKYASATAEMIYVGKATGDHTMTQSEINRLLVESAGKKFERPPSMPAARSLSLGGDEKIIEPVLKSEGATENDARPLSLGGDGKIFESVLKSDEAATENDARLPSLSGDNKIIVRLKGGDPFVFGRGGEEALTLVEYNIPFEIVPGVTSAIAVPAYAGIPVTHRGVATSFAVVTGHEMNDERSNIRWDKLATAVDTLIFLMGVANLAKITQRLIANGRAPETPAAVIRCGTRSNQRTLITTVERAADDVEREGITAPAIFIVGNVVELRDRLQWFETRPLFGRKIVVTRARAQASALSSKLIELGAQCIEFPTIEIVDPSDRYASLDSALDQLSTFDIIIFTSVNGVEKFFDRLLVKALDVRMIRAKIAAIGSATEAALRSHALIADYVPGEFRAEALIKLLRDKVDGKKILIARAEEARSILPLELRRLGATVEVAAAYRTVSAVDKAIPDGVDWITFTSSSTVKNFVKSFGAEMLSKVKTAAIGPITADTLNAFGVEPTVVASEFTIDGLIRAIVDAKEC